MNVGKCVCVLNWMRVTEVDCEYKKVLPTLRRAVNAVDMAYTQSIMNEFNFDKT